MKFIRRIGIFFLVLLFLLIGAMIVTPMLFKEQIFEFAKQSVNDSVHATVEFEDAGLSFFRSFPNLNFRLQNYAVTGKDEFEGITLAAGERFSIAVDPFSVIWGPIQVKSIRLDKPILNIHVLSDGKANYDIAVSAEEQTGKTETDYVVELQSYRIYDGYISYNDQTLGLETELAGLNHSGKGNFTLDIFDLDTETEIAYWSLDYGNIAYLDSVRTDLEAVLKVDLRNQKYTLRENQIILNELEASAKGFVQLEETGDNILMDLAFNTPSNEFKDLLSILPNAYTADFRKVRADGSFQLDGVAEGIYNATKETYPSLLLDLQVKNGYVKYPDLALPVEDLNVNMNVNKPEGSLDATVVDISNFAMSVGSDPIEGYLKLKTPLSDPDIDTRINANLGLNNLSKAYPMDGVKELAGRIVADFRAKAKQSDIERGNYTAVDMSGQVAAQDVLYVANGMPNVDVKNALVKFSPQYTEVTNFDARLGKSDVYAAGKIFNPLAYLSPNQTVRGEMRLRSNYFNADEWLETEESNDIPMAETQAVGEDVADEIDFDIDAEMRRIEYDVYELSDLKAKAKVSFNDLNLQEFYTKVNGSDVSVTGQASNVYNFAMNEGVLKGKFDLRSNTFDLDKLLYPEGVAASEEASGVEEVGEVLPYRYDLDLIANANTIIYSPYELKAFRTSGQVTEKELKLTNFDTKIKDGDVRGSGVITDYMEYVFAGDTVRGKFDIQSDFLNMNSILASEEYIQNIADETPQTAEPEDLEAYILDPKWDFVFDSRLAKVLYTDMDLRNLKGKLSIRQGRLLFEDTNAELLGGSMAITGGYDTSEPEKPYFDMKFALDDVSFAQAFNTFNTFKILAPVGKFIDGKINFDLIFNSVLGQDMMPDLMTINADGFVTTLQAFIKGFAPLRSIGNQLGIEAFDEFKIQDSKNWFSIKDGTVTVDNISLTKNDIRLDISGTHGLNQDMNYVIDASIPKSQLGNGANQGMAFLEGKASSLGLNLDTGTHVNLQIGLTGSMTTPKFNIVPKGTETRALLKSTVTDAADDVIKDARAEAEDVVKERLDEEKAKLENKANAVVDSAKAVVEQKVEDVKKQVGDEVGKKAEEILGEEAEKIKDKLDKYNPFKNRKKKKDGN